MLTPARTDEAAVVLSEEHPWQGHPEEWLIRIKFTVGRSGGGSAGSGQHKIRPFPLPTDGRARRWHTRRHLDGEVAERMSRTEAKER
jgi:hypothetical protein